MRLDYVFCVHVVYGMVASHIIFRLRSESVFESLNDDA